MYVQMRRRRLAAAAATTTTTTATSRMNSSCMRGRNVSRKRMQCNFMSFCGPAHPLSSADLGDQKRKRDEDEQVYRNRKGLVTPWMSKVEALESSSSSSPSSFQSTSKSTPCFCTTDAKPARLYHGCRPSPDDQPTGAQARSRIPAVPEKFRTR